MVIKSVHLSDPDAEVRVVQIGRVVGPATRTSSEDDPEEIQIRCETLASKMRRQIMSILVEPQCQYAVYGAEGCTVDINSFLETVTVLSANASGTQFTIDAIPAGRVAADYVGGVLIYDGQQRWIQSVTSTTFTMFDVFADLALDIGSPPPTVDIAPGCDQSAATCEDRFNNTINRLAFDWLPNREAFTGAIF